jgi:carboxypeptidase C (cathepsin A)
VEVDEDAGAELFYYFVQSESESAGDAPLLLWLTGGQRCSALSGLAYEIGTQVSLPFICVQAKHVT